MPSTNFKKLSEITTIKKVTDDNYKNANCIFIKSHGSYATVGKLSKTKESSHTYVIDVTNLTDIDSTYLYEQLQNKQDEISNYAFGTNILHINKIDIENIMIPMP